MQSKSLILLIIIGVTIVAGVSVLLSHHGNNSNGEVVVMSVNEYINDGIYEKIIQPMNFLLIFAL